MHYLLGMSTPQIALASIAALTTGLLFAGSSHADGYVGAGIGSDSSISGELGSHFQTNDKASSSRVIIGQRFGALALEASLFGSQLHGTSAMVGSDDYATISLGVDLKYHLGLIGGLEAYGKLGLNKTWLSGPAKTEGAGYEGRGKALGLGLQYTFDLPLASVSLWADYTVQRTKLRDGERQNLDGELAMANFGVSLGF